MNDWLESTRGFFTTLGGTTRLTDEQVEERLDEAAASNCDTLLAFVEVDGSPLWPSAYSKISPLSEGTDVVGALVKGARARGMRFVASWMGVHTQSDLITRHSGWLQHDPWGRPIGAMCLNSPFGSFLLASVAEVIEKYGVDGVYFDGLYSRAGGCFCVYCSEKFLQLYGYPILSAVELGDEPEAALSSHWVDFVKVAPPNADHDAFRFETVLEFGRRLRAAAVGASGPVPIILDTLGLRSSYFSMGHDLVRLAESIDVFLLEAYWDHRKVPVGDIAIEAALVKAETGRPIWWPRWIARHPDEDQVAIPPATVRTWAAQTMVTGSSPVPVEQNLFASDKSIAATLAETMGDSARLQEWIGVPKTSPSVVLMHSTRTKEAGSLQRPFVSRQYLDSFYGAFEWLREAHIPAQVLSDRTLEADGIPAGCDVVVLPNAMILTDAMVDELVRHSEAGGGIVATYRTGMGTAASPSAQKQLAELLGRNVLGTTSRNGRAGPEAFGGREPVTYYETADVPALDSELRSRRFSVKGPLLQVEALAGTEVWASALEADFLRMDGTRFWAWGPGERSYPFAIASEHGAKKGRVVYLAAPLDAVFMRNGHDEAAALLTAAVSWAGKGKVRAVCETDGIIDVQVFEPAEGTNVAVLANRATNNLYSLDNTSHQDGFGYNPRAQYVRRIIPATDVRLILHRQGGAGSPSVTTLSGAEARVEADGETLTVTIPRVGAYEAVKVDWNA
jgi:hypothetical protein